MFWQNHITVRPGNRRRRVASKKMAQDLTTFDHGFDIYCMNYTSYSQNQIIHQKASTWKQHTAVSQSTNTIKADPTRLTIIHVNLIFLLQMNHIEPKDNSTGSHHRRKSYFYRLDCIDEDILYKKR
jgi:hypothetical protein